MPDPNGQMTKEEAQSILDASAASQAARQKEMDDLARANYYKLTLSWGLGFAGNVAGVLVAIKRKSGFWGGLGWFLLLGAAGAAVGYVAGTVIDGKPKAGIDDAKDS